jgi:hypothetical protein
MMSVSPHNLPMKYALNLRPSTGRCPLPGFPYRILAPPTNPPPNHSPPPHSCPDPCASLLFLPWPMSPISSQNTILGPLPTVVPLSLSLYSSPPLLPLSSTIPWSLYLTLFSPQILLSYPLSLPCSCPFPLLYSSLDPCLFPFIPHLIVVPFPWFPNYILRILHVWKKLVRRMLFYNTVP